MKKLNFKGAEYTKINVTKILEIHQKVIDKLLITSGDCIGNSYKIAKKNH